MWVRLERYSSHLLYRLPDWLDQFPMHKFACEGDVERVRRCVKVGVAPNEKDTDSWTPLHYACWYEAERKEE